ncbi:OsmC family peroxiredoxin [Brevibacterium samyangense]|uniref:OsmC family protein n=1 Tax=Brevibacterium samyangense TaxID=366888 RepID=A0ABP5EUE2_9MICO
MAHEIVSTAHTQWRGSLREGTGSVSLDSSGTGSLPLSWAVRAEKREKGTTSPEELLGAAHSACFSMALSNALTNAGTPPESISTNADVTFVAGEGITEIHLVTVAEVPEMSAADFETHAQRAKRDCPVSKALKGVSIRLSATLR